MPPDYDAACRSRSRAPDVGLRHGGNWVSQTRKPAPQGNPDTLWKNPAPDRSQMPVHSDRLHGCRSRSQILHCLYLTHPMDPPWLRGPRKALPIGAPSRFGENVPARCRLAGSGRICELPPDSGAEAGKTFPPAL